ncbi:hypothetical protein L195_g033165, partial [Trifolium pratense]
GIGAPAGTNPPPVDDFLNGPAINLL